MLLVGCRCLQILIFRHRAHGHIQHNILLLNLGEQQKNHMLSVLPEILHSANP